VSKNNTGSLPLRGILPVIKMIAAELYKSFHSIHNVVDRGVLQAMSAKLYTVINSLSANHANLKTLYKKTKNVLKN